MTGLVIAAAIATLALLLCWWAARKARRNFRETWVDVQRILERETK